MTEKITTRLTQKYECIAKLKSEPDAFSSRRADEILRELPSRNDRKIYIETDAEIKVYGEAIWAIAPSG